MPKNSRCISLPPDVVFYDVSGCTREQDGVYFVPAHFEFISESPGTIECTLENSGLDLLTINNLVDQIGFYEALRQSVWVCGRIVREFKVSLFQIFGAPREEVLGIPFLALMPMAKTNEWTAVP